ncbi:MAG TPA: KH domain-containing protein [Anaerolineaceae bacterium]|jgi:hypothetical protein|nr:KH domain-containing protein [Anaerolineales bacterium]HOG59441.1 KH domain-containing protein [Anaerolineaceae bacterium]HOR84416.1 KH domain-containing protein [Anaerolineaceae bacterium]HOT52754.1 KH domain-containing protein [Anaerolineaceae bacterium]HPL43828.1 KH domain-containing protein [Anaerolineaceae bacterium]
MERETLSGLLEYLAKSLVDKPEAVKVETYRDGQLVHLDLIVDSEDIGRVIGKHGRVANALRVLLRVVAARGGQQVAMDVVDFQ